MAAVSVAERVADELLAEPVTGRLVGYQIRMEARRTAATRLLFCTTGVVLRKLMDDPMLQGITHGMKCKSKLFGHGLKSSLSVLTVN